MLIDHFVQIQVLGLDDLAAAEGEELAGEVGGALGGQADLLGGVQRFLGQFRRQGKQRGMALNDGEDVVEIMGDAAGELADGFHFLGLAQLGLKILPFGDVARITMDDADGRDREKRPGDGAIVDDGLMAQFALAGGEAFLDHGRRFGRQKFGRMLPAEGLGHLQRGFVEVIDCAVAGQFQHGVGIELGKGGELLVFSRRANALQRPAAMIGQGLQRIEIILGVGLRGIALNAQNADDSGAVPDGNKHQRGGRAGCVAKRNEIG